MGFQYTNAAKPFARALRKAPEGTAAFLTAMTADIDESSEKARSGEWTDDHGVAHDRPCVYYAWETAAAMAGYTPEECLKGGRSAGYQGQQRIMKFLARLGILTQYRAAIKGIQTAGYEVNLLRMQGPTWTVSDFYAELRELKRGALGMEQPYEAATQTCQPDDTDTLAGVSEHSSQMTPTIQPVIPNHPDRIHPQENHPHVESHAYVHASGGDHELVVEDSRVDWDAVIESNAHDLKALQDVWRHCYSAGDLTPGLKDRLKAAAHALAKPEPARHQLEAFRAIWPAHRLNKGWENAFRAAAGRHGENAILFTAYRLIAETDPQYVPGAVKFLESNEMAGTANDVLGDDCWVPPAPPAEVTAGLTDIRDVIGAEQAWMREKRSEHAAERTAEALLKVTDAEAYAAGKDAVVTATINLAFAKLQGVAA